MKQCALQGSHVSLPDLHQQQQSYKDWKSYGRNFLLVSINQSISQKIYIAPIVEVESEALVCEWLDVIGRNKKVRFKTGLESSKTIRWADIQRKRVPVIVKCIQMLCSCYVVPIELVNVWILPYSCSSSPELKSCCISVLFFATILLCPIQSFDAVGGEQEFHPTHTHIHTCHFNGHFPDKSGLIGCLLDFQSIPVILIPIILPGQAKILCTHMILRAVPCPHSKGFWSRCFYGLDALIVAQLTASKL